MKKNVQSKKEVYVVFFAFLAIVFLVIASKIFSFYQVETLHKTTSNIYEHPLKVSNAALNVKLEVYKIHRDMKDIIFSSSEQELNSLIKKVDQQEKNIYKYLDIIGKNILGSEGQKFYKETVRLYGFSKPMRDRVIQLVQEDKMSQAIKISKTQGPEHVLKLEDSTQQLYLYAKNKADKFKQTSDLTFDYLTSVDYIISIIIFILFLTIVYYTIGRISKYIDKNEHLNGVLSVIRDVNQLIVREKEVEKMLQESCEILTSSHVYGHSWIMILNDENRVEYIVGTDRSEKFESFKNRVRDGWSPYCINKTDDNFSYIANTQQTCAECPLKDQYSSKSAFNIELKYENKLYGYLNIAVDEEYILDDHEFALLNEVAGDIAYALYNFYIEELLKQKEERYRFVVEGSTDGFWDWDIVNHEVYFSPRWKEMLGYSDDELKNSFDTWESRLHPDDKEQVFLDIDLSHQGKTKQFRNIHRLKHRDGHWTWIDARAQTIFDEDGKAIRMAGSHTDITELKNSEMKLRASNEKFEKAFKFSPIIVAITNFKTGEIYDINNAFKTAFGYVEEDIIGKTTLEINLWHDAKDRKKYTQNLNKYKHTGGDIYEFNHKNSSRVIAKMYGSLITIDNEEYILTVAEDITKMKETEQLFLESEERFRLLMEQSPSVFEIYDINGLQVNVNHAYETLWGFPASQTLNKFNVLESEEVKRTGLIEYVKRAYLGEYSEVPIYEFNPAGKTESGGKGRVRSLSTRVFPLKSLSGKVSHIVITHEDVTDKEDALKSLKQEQYKLQTIFNEAPLPMAIHNEDGEILMINKAWEEQTGYKHEEINTTAKWTRKVSPQNSEPRKEHIDKLYSITKRVDEGNFDIITKDGKKLIWAFSSSPFGVIDEKRVLISTATDITELKKKDELMINQSRHAAMGEMIGMIAHQWRQPLSSISMGTNNILADIAMEEIDMTTLQEYASTISEQTQHLSKTIDDFRNFFKPDKVISKVNMKDIFNQTLSIVKDSLQNNNIEITHSFETDKEVKAYPRELMQVFVNIITNSKDALVSNAVEDAFVSFRVYENKKYVNIEICDNGGGIDADILPKVFDPYFSTKDEKTGTGLGLYMSKMIIQEHLRGTIKIKNSGKGTCVTVGLLKILED